MLGHQVPGGLISIFCLAVSVNSASIHSTLTRHKVGSDIAGYFQICIKISSQISTPSLFEYKLLFASTREGPEDPTRLFSVI